MLQETTRQVPVRVQVPLQVILHGAVHDWEGGHEVPARARGRGGAVALRRGEPSVQLGRRPVGRVDELLQPVVAELPHEVSSRSMCSKNSSTEVPPGR